MSTQYHHGDWVICTCGESSLYVFRDPADWVCSVCGGGAPMKAEKDEE